MNRRERIADAVGRISVAHTGLVLALDAGQKGDAALALMELGAAARDLHSNLVNAPDAFRDVLAETKERVW